jgi:plasmid stabilization system protein ParE
MGEVRWTHEAVRWLNEIHSYIARDNPAAAARTVEGIYEKAQVLAYSQLAAPPSPGGRAATAHLAFRRGSNLIKTHY